MAKRDRSHTLEADSGNESVELDDGKRKKVKYPSEQTKRTRYAKLTYPSALSAQKFEERAAAIFDQPDKWIFSIFASGGSRVVFVEGIKRLSTTFTKDAYHISGRCPQSVEWFDKKKHFDAAQGECEASVEQPKPHDILTSTLQSEEDALAPHTRAWREAIARAGGVTRRGESIKCAELWEKMGCDLPRIFPVNQCWPIIPTEDELFSDVLSSFQQDEAKIYVRGSTHEPLPGSQFSKVIRQLYRPDPESPMYAINIPTDKEMRLPEGLAAGKDAYFANVRTSVNVTPRYSVVDLHNDRGRHGLTGLSGEEALKLWAFYPPTETNREHLINARHSQNKFNETHKRLEGGAFLLTDSKDVVYLPPLCLHATFTLGGCLVPGINFSDARSLSMAVASCELERKMYDQTPDCTAVLEACIACMRSSDLGLKLSCWEVICKFKTEFQNLSTGKKMSLEFKELIDAIGGRNPACKCGQPIKGGKK